MTERVITYVGRYLPHRAIGQPAGLRVKPGVRIMGTDDDTREALFTERDVVGVPQIDELTWQGGRKVDDHRRATLVLTPEAAERVARAAGNVRVRFGELPAKWAGLAFAGDPETQPDVEAELRISIGTLSADAFIEQYLDAQVQTGD